MVAKRCIVKRFIAEPTGQPIHQGYHLVESIALGERPGTWHTQPEAGPQNIDWNPHAIVPRMTSVIAHESGVKAAIWILERLLQSDVNRRKLLIEWVRLLMERPSLIEPLGLVQILLKLSQDDSEEVAMSTSLCLAKLIDFDRDSGMRVCQELMARDEVMVRRAMADVLTRLFRRLTFDAIPYFNKLRQDEDENVLAAVSSTSGDLRFLDTDLWANTLVELSNHKLPVVRRNIVPSLRDYFRNVSRR